MGEHYVPQAYLRAFASGDPPKFVWMFNKSTSELREVAIRQAAQERNFYGKEVERLLTDQIESPANSILRQLRSGTPAQATAATARPDSAAAATCGEMTAVSR